MDFKLAVVPLISLMTVGMLRPAVGAQAPTSPTTTTSPATATTTSPATATSSTTGGVYTEAQAKRGEALYDQACAECHGASLTGAGQGPPLVGGDFTTGWTGQTLGDLLEKLRVSMPAGGPDRMTLQQKADMLAYILSANKFPVGSTELASDIEALKKIPFDAPKP